MILLDSDVVIAHLRHGGAATDWMLRVRRVSGPLAISAVTIAEVAGGMRSGERREVTKFLTSMRCLPVSQRIAWAAAEFRRTFAMSHGGIGLGDYLVAATAHVEGLELATLNVRHFPMFEGLTPPFAL